MRTTRLPITHSNRAKLSRASLLMLAAVLLTLSLPTAVRAEIAPDDHLLPARPAMPALAQAEDTGADGTLRLAGENARRAAPFRKGSWTFQTYGSGVVFDDDHGDLYTAHVGGGYHFKDDLSINLEGVGGWADSRTDNDGGVGGLDLLFRWHFTHDPDYRWTLYADGGAGFQQATTDFPSDSHHNFRPQFGLGGTLRLDDDLRLMGGARWLHVSNAGTTSGNDGGDWAQLYLGLMMNF